MAPAVTAAAMAKAERVKRIVALVGCRKMYTRLLTAV